MPLRIAGRPARRRQQLPQPERLASRNAPPDHRVIEHGFLACQARVSVRRRLCEIMRASTRGSKKQRAGMLQRARPLRAIMTIAMRAKPKFPEPPALDTFALLSMRWAEGLTAELRRRVVTETTVRRVQSGRFVCRKGEPVEYWIGVIEGLVKLSSGSREGKTISFTGIPAGGWFGEGSLLKSEPRRYDAVALRDSVVAYMPRDTFTLLLDSSVAFNRFLLTQLNERLGQFIAMVEHDRLLGPEGRLATELAALFNPHLYPGNRSTLRISQEELAHLVGLSRQRVNKALKRLVEDRLVRIDYRDVTILDIERLRRYEG
jgi:CRP-like cAMP-binding protein